MRHGYCVNATQTSKTPERNEGKLDNNKSKMMIIDAIKGNSGQGNAMYSRSGKATINQYIAFNPKNSVDLTVKKPYEDDPDYDDLKDFFPMVRALTTGTLNGS
jgi:hypothetical protein